MTMVVTIKYAAVGFFGAMMTVYDEHGGTYKINEPQTWKEYERSRWFDDTMSGLKC